MQIINFSNFFVTKFLNILSYKAMRKEKLSTIKNLVKILNKKKL